MRINRLSLRGITALSDVSLDLRDVPPGLIAVVGENGAGKTTLLESMFAGFYGEFASRKDLALVDAVSGARDAFIDVEAAFTGRGTYRGLVSIDGLKRSRNAVLEQVNADGTRTPLTDGKVTTYAERVAAIFPNPRVLLASAFGAQNRAGSFATADRRARKDIASALLGHQHLEAMAETARAAMALIDRRLTEVRAALEVSRQMAPPARAAELDAEAAALAESRVIASARAADAAAALARATEAAATCRQRLDALQAVRQALAVQQQAIDEARHWAQRLELQRRDLDARTSAQREAAERTRERIVTDARARLSQLPTAETLQAEYDRACQAAADAYARRHADLSERIANNEALLADRASVEAQQQAVEAATREVTARREDLAAAREAWSLATQAVDRCAAVVTRLAPARGLRDLALAEIARSSELPFGDRCVDSGCRFVASAVEAREALPGLERDVVEWDAAQARLRDANTHRDAKERALTDASRDADAAETALADLYPTRVADRVAKLQAAEQRLVDLRRDLADAGEARDRAVAGAAEQREQRRQEAAQTCDVLGATLFEADRAHAETRAQIDAEAERARLNLDRERGAAAAAEEQAVAAAAPLQAQLEGEAELLARSRQADGAVSDNRELVATLAGERTRLDHAAVSLEMRQHAYDLDLRHRTRLEGAEAHLEREIGEWKILAQVFGRDGLPVFEIDAAGPAVSAIANDLIQASFGGRFVLELVTQEAKASGKGTKETFEIKVYDAAKGGDTRDLAALSGGEQVIVDEALKSALAAYANLRSGCPVETLWRDETIGALDVENKHRYMAMLRRLRERCGVHHVFMVVHDAEIAAMADAQIQVAGGTARLVYPPFTGATEAA